MKSLNILLCDDDALLLAVVGDQLLALGHTIETARDGLQALELLKLNHYDLAILDFLMPRKNGLEVLRELKRWPKRPKVIMLSAISPKTLPDLRDAEPEALLEKPVKAKQLEKVLASLGFEP